MSQCKGKITAIGEVKSGKGQHGDWSSQQWVVEEEGQQYPESWVLETFGEENIKKFDIHVGDVVAVQYNARSREKDGHYYGTNRAWSVTKIA